MGGVGQITSLISHHLIAQMPALAQRRAGKIGGGGGMEGKGPFGSSSDSACFTGMENPQPGRGGHVFWWFCGFFFILNESYHPKSHFGIEILSERHSALRRLARILLHVGQ